MRRIAGWPSALRQARAVESASGKRLARQVAEMVRLRVGPGRIMPFEYFVFGLHDDIRFTPDEKLAFRGTWAKGRVYSVNRRHWRAVGDDKLLAHLLFESLGLPSPQVQAVFHPSRRHPKVTMLRTEEDVTDFLSSGAAYPLFKKPVADGSGVDAYRIDSFNAGDASLRLGNGDTLRFETLMTELRRGRGGSMFQELIRPHADVVRLCGDRAATIRLVVLLAKAGPVLHRAAIRIPAGRSMIDNFRGGKSGNFAAALDLETGRITRTVAATVTDCRAPVADRHPDTGAGFVDFVVPEWKRMVEMCLDAAAALPGLPVQNWDATATTSGPSFIELNTRGDFNITQIPHDRGIADECWRSILST